MNNKSVFTAIGGIIGFSLIIGLAGFLYTKIFNESIAIDERVAADFLKRDTPVDVDLEYLLNRLEIPDGYEISIFASGFVKPRSLTFAPNGTMLVGDLETGDIFALPDENNDGVADGIHIVLENLDFPNSIDFYEDNLFVALKNGVFSYRYDQNSFKGSDQKKVVPLPVKALIRHQTRTIQFGPDEKMYIAVSSTCDACEEDDERYATILQANPDGSGVSIFARGLRNTVYFTFDSKGQIWGNDMGQDDLGPDLPPDEVNLIQQGNHYGWPYCYGDNIVGIFGNDSSECFNKTRPAYKYIAHVAPLGIAFIDSPMFPADWQGDALTALHGSWNKEDPVGYKISRLIIENDQVVGEEDFITGWLEYIPGSNSALTSPGRPAYLIFDEQGSLYITDDKAGVIFKVTRKN